MDGLEQALGVEDHGGRRRDGAVGWRVRDRGAGGGEAERGQGEQSMKAHERLVSERGYPPRPFSRQEARNCFLGQTIFFP